MEPTKQYDILDNDYKRKCEQAHNHLVSLFTRFNYFLAFQGLVVGATLLKQDNEANFRIPLCVVGITTSILWYCIAANDRFLVKIYRLHVRSSFTNLQQFLAVYAPDLSIAKDHVMNIRSEDEQPQMNILGWRISSLGLTDYFVIFPMCLCAFWILFLNNVF